jgi:hypothetical protein
MSGFLAAMTESIGIVFRARRLIEAALRSLENHFPRGCRPGKAADALIPHRGHRQVGRASPGRVGDKALLTFPVSAGAIAGPRLTPEEVSLWRAPRREGSPDARNGFTPGVGVR